jgi:hypothetical protein
LGPDEPAAAAAAAAEKRLLCLAGVCCRKPGLLADLPPTPAGAAAPARSKTMLAQHSGVRA